MARRKKYPKLPNGFGSIKYLGKGRRNPYAVHPPTKAFTLDGIPKTPRAICYVDDWMKGFAVLTAYKAGTYTPGMEKELSESFSADDSGIVQRILADYSLIKGIAPEAPDKTFREVYEEYYEYKYNRDKSRTYSQASRNSTKAAFNNCAVLHDKEFRSLTHDDLQAVIDNCPLKHASLELIANLFKQMYAYAEIYDLYDKDASKHITINIPDDDEHGEPFSDDDLKILWQHKADPVVEMLLIMIYSGFRISAYHSISVNLSAQYFQGGVKTKAGKNRIVPIHSAILPLVRKRMKRDGAILTISNLIFRRDMYEKLQELGIDKHTPHDCRHTFSMLCEKYRVNENDRKRLLGHKFQDVTNKVYGHREIEDLRTEIEKIKICC